MSFAKALDSSLEDCRPAAERGAVAKDTKCCQPWTMLTRSTLTSRQTAWRIRRGWLTLLVAVAFVSCQVTAVFRYFSLPSSKEPRYDGRISCVGWRQTDFCSPFGYAEAHLGTQRTSAPVMHGTAQRKDSQQQIFCQQDFESGQTKCCSSCTEPQHTSNSCHLLT